MITGPSPQSPLFKGFPEGKVRFTRLPGPFFSDLLIQIDDLAELKVTIYCLWFVEQSEGNFRYLCRADFIQDPRFMRGLGPEPENKLDQALNRAVTRGTLLQTRLATENEAEPYYFLNSPRGQAAVAAINRGEWRPSGDAHHPVSLDLERPNIFRLYEENIGPITPMIRDELLDAETHYPAVWIEDAMRTAVENNVRRWRYILAILRSWQEEGRDEQNRGDTQKDRRRYVEGPFADFIEH
jgi:DNA replication protein